MCVDSGCGRSTTGPAVAEELGYAVEPTVQSQKGHYFVSPGGERYYNRSRVQLKSKDKSSRQCITKFHVAEGIDQSLASVAEMNDSNNMLVFDSEGSASIPGTSPEAAAIRKAIRRCTRATTVHRRKNSFFIPLWVQPETGTGNRQCQTPFVRQGR